MTDRPVETGSETEQSYVSAIMEREAELELAKPAPLSKRSRLPILVALVVLLMPLVGWNAYRLLTTPAPFTSDEEAVGARLAIYLTAHELQLFRDSTGAFPATLSAVALDEDNLQYIRSGDGYMLTASWEGGAVTFQAGEDLGPFVDALDTFANEAGR